MKGAKLHIELDVDFKNGSWRVSYNGLELCAVGAKKIHFRDELLRKAAWFFSELANRNTIEVLNEVYFDPSFKVTEKAVTRDEKWFYAAYLLGYDTRYREIVRAVPKWEFPKWGKDENGENYYASSSANTLNFYKALKMFIRIPEVRKKLLLSQTSSKFGL